MSSCSEVFESHRRRGVALLLVLGILVVLTWMVTVFLDRVVDRMAETGFVEENLLLRQSAYQALEITLAVMDEVRGMDGGLFAAGQGWGDPFGYLGIKPYTAGRSILADGAGEEEGQNSDFVTTNRQEVPRPMEGGDFETIRFPSNVQLSIRIRDLHGYFPIHGTSVDRWHLIFEHLGFSDSEKDLLTDSLLDWMDGDDEPRLHGAESNYYQEMEPPYSVPNRPIEFREELRLIRGFRDLFFDEAGVPNAQAEAFWNLVAIVPDGHELNFNALSRDHLEIIEEENELSADRMERFLAGDDLRRGTLEDRVLRPGGEEDELPTDQDGNPPPRNVESRFFDIEIEASAGVVQFVLSARIDAAGTGTGVYPMRILELREDRLWR